MHSSRWYSPRNVLAGLGPWALALILLGPFLIYPVFSVLKGALVQQGRFAPELLLLPVRDPFMRDCLRNSFVLGVAITVLSALLAFPLAFAAARLNFAGKTWLTGLTLVPLLLPPLVGAVGIKRMLSREGVVENLLRTFHLTDKPVDFLTMAAPMVVIVGALHAYPLIYLNLSAAWANVDASLEEAAENLGASGWRVFRSVTLPLLLPGFLSGALIVFVIGFTDLGTPLVFNYDKIAAFQIFAKKDEIGAPEPYLLACWVLVVAAIVFALSRKISDGARIATLARGTRRAREETVTGWKLAGVYFVFATVIGLSLLPHFGVIVASLARDWTATIMPEWTLNNYRDVFHNPQTTSAIKISLLCAFFSMIIDVVAGFFLAYALVRGKVWARGWLDTLAMLPLALPGLVLAFGLLKTYSGVPGLDPFTYSVPLLIISYAVRRLPYGLRAVASGLQQTSVSLEEASLNLGASPLRTMWQITRPLVMANIMAAALLTFAFAVLEVSDSLILSLDSRTEPIAAAINALRNTNEYTACALGVVGMALLTVTFMGANRVLGKQLGALFRV